MCGDCSQAYYMMQVQKRRQCLYIFLKTILMNVPAFHIIFAYFRKFTRFL